jgi:hypothetical protein
MKGAMPPYWMHMKTFLPLILILVTACSCKPIKYTSDFGFLPSAQANSPEFLVKINGKYCKDMDGRIGLCAKRVRSNEKIILVLDARPYSYRLNVNCSSLVDFNLSVDVAQNAAFSFEIHPDSFQEVKSFTCIGEVFPQDRPQEVSAFWHSRFVVFDKEYQERESIYSDGEHLVLGQNARFSLLNEEKAVSKKTRVKAAGINKAYSESETMRFNYWGY